MIQIEIDLSKLERGLREGRVKVTRGGKTFYRRQRVGVKEVEEKINHSKIANNFLDNFSTRYNILIFGSKNIEKLYNDFDLPMGDAKNKLIIKILKNIKDNNIPENHKELLLFNAFKDYLPKVQKLMSIEPDKQFADAFSKMNIGNNVSRKNNTFNITYKDYSVDIVFENGKMKIGQWDIDSESPHIFEWGVGSDNMPEIKGQFGIDQYLDFYVRDSEDVVKDIKDFSVHLNASYEKSKSFTKSFRMQWDEENVDIPNIYKSLIGMMFRQYEDWQTGTVVGMKGFAKSCLLYKSGKMNKSDMRYPMFDLFSKLSQKITKTQKNEFLWRGESNPIVLQQFFKAITTLKKDKDVLEINLDGKESCWTDDSNMAMSWANKGSMKWGNQKYRGIRIGISKDENSQSVLFNYKLMSESIWMEESEITLMFRKNLKIILDNVDIITDNGDIVSVEDFKNLGGINNE